MIVKHIDEGNKYHTLVRQYTAAHGVQAPMWHHFTGHSFRVGGLNALRCALRAAHISGDDLMRSISQYGRLKSGSRMVYHYLHEPNSRLAAAINRKTNEGAKRFL